MNSFLTGFIFAHLTWILISIILVLRGYYKLKTKKANIEITFIKVKVEKTEDI